ncbi:hypothetical protein Tco_0878614 [Tanacetum coccineum]|uniref:Uncharacterized protein n=1 Tax=Tanacetum coccineum TaxID=301880 RepID=A0ABQ5C1T0_9ASTR
MSVIDLVVRLRIRICTKEDNKLAQKNTYTPNYAKENMVKHAPLSSKTNSKGKGKGKGDSTRDNMVNDNLDMIAMVSDIIAMISEVNLRTTSWLRKTLTPDYSKANMVEHASLSSKTKSKVKGKGKGKGKVEYLALEVGLTNMVNDNLDMIAMMFDVIAMISEVNLGERDAILQMTSGKELNLTNVLYVPEVHNNLVSG